MKYPRQSTLLAGMAAVALTLPAVPAYADPGQTVDEVAAAVANVAPAEIAPADLAPVGTGVVAPLDGGGRTHMSNNPAGGIQVMTAQGDVVVSFTLPAAGRLDDAVVADDGSVTYLGNTAAPSVNVVAADEAIRVSTVIVAPEQTEVFPYDFGPGVTVEVQEDGSAIAYVMEEFVDPNTGESIPAEKIIADIAPPWAKDANGVNVPTRYEADGSVLTQIVDHAGGDYAYPVVADPVFDRPNIFQYRVRFNRAETATIASGGAGVIASIGCGIMLPVCVAAGGTIWWQASVAQNSSPKRCVQITATQPYVVPGMYWWVDQYTGGPCR